MRSAAKFRAEDARREEPKKSCAISKNGHAEREPSRAANWDRHLGTDLVVCHHSENEFAACLGPGGRFSACGNDLSARKMAKAVVPTAARPKCDPSIDMEV